MWIAIAIILFVLAVIGVLRHMINNRHAWWEPDDNDEDKI